MKGRIFVGFFLCSLFFVVGGDAQSPDKAEKPVWTLEFLQVQPGQGGLAMGYLDDHWMRVRAEAKKLGVVLDYHRISGGTVEIDGHKTGHPGSLVLMTEYKNFDTFMQSEKLFASIEERLPKSTPGVFKPTKPDDLYETVDSRVFVEEPNTDAEPGFKLIAKQ